MKKVLAINSGSSSFKYKLFSFPSQQVIAKGGAERVGMPNSIFKIKLANGNEYIKNMSISMQKDAVKLLIECLKKYHVVENLSEIKGVGHRIVNGGEVFSSSVVIDNHNLHKLERIAQFAPLHNGPETEGVKAFMSILPNVPQVAVFDTAYHHTLDAVHYLYSIPYNTIKITQCVNTVHMALLYATLHLVQPR